MKTKNIEAFTVVGLSVRTTNENNEAAKDIGDLWAKFMTEDIASKIPGKIDESIYSIYTNYQGDHTQPYDTILGCRVSDLNNIPEGMVGQQFEGGEHAHFISKGDATKGAIYQTWCEIWESDLNRKYSADFEVYGEKAMNPNDAEVDIFVAIKE